MQLLRCLSDFYGTDRGLMCFLGDAYWIFFLPKFFLPISKKSEFDRGEIAHFTSRYGIRWKKALCMCVKMNKRETRTYYICEKRQWKRVEEVGLYLYWRITESCTSHRQLSCSLCRVTELWVLFKPQAWESWIGLNALHLTSTVCTLWTRDNRAKNKDRGM